MFFKKRRKKKKYIYIYIYNITFRLSMTDLLSYCPLISAFQIYYIKI